MTPAEHLQRWLSRALTGCSFASLLAKSERGLMLSAFDGVASSLQLDKMLVYAASIQRPATLVLVAARTERQLVDQLLELASGERWKVLRVTAPIVTDDVLIAIEWRTDSGAWSSVMGLGPFGTMPATRRAPYAAIAAWPGGHENTFRTKVESVVHFLDVDLSAERLTAKRYADMTKASRKSTAEFLADDSARHYRNVAFRLSPSSSERLVVLPLL